MYRRGRLGKACDKTWDRCRPAGARKHNSAQGIKRTVANVIRKSVFPGVDLIPSHLDLFLIDLDLASAIAREKKLALSIAPKMGDYDVVICDCPPNLTLPTQNALAISTHYLVPVSPDFLSGIGVGILLGRIDELAQDLGSSLKLAGIVFSRVGRKAEHREQTVATIRNQFGSDVLNAVIKERVAVAQSAERHCPIYDMGDSSAAKQFRELSQEVLQRIGL